MPQQRVNKNYYNFSKGLNSDANPLEFPEGFTLDEENFVLDINGSRRRRAGLVLEQGGSTSAVTTSVGDVVRSFKWSNVAGLSNVNFHVVQIGYNLHFYNDNVVSVSPTKRGFVIDLTLYKTATATSSDVASNPVDVAYGRGHMFVVGTYINPFWVAYDSNTGNIAITPINITERDFEGIDDGISVTAQPTSASTSHTYNLYNRGWTSANLSSFASAQSKQPSKNLVPYLGMRRATTANVAEQDWTKEFSSAKLVAELFQDASAPTGHFLRDPFNTSTVGLPDTSTQYTITAWSLSGTTAGNQTITLTLDRNHSLSAGNKVYIEGQSAYFDLGGFGGETVTIPLPFNGEQTVTATPAANTFSFVINFPEDFTAWFNQYAAFGTVSTNVVSNPSGYVAYVRPSCTAFFAGRVWYAGTPYSRLANKIFFSQVIESDGQYGKCYQVADPTQEEFNDLVDTDGGTLTIPEIASVLRIVPLSSFLLVFASNGVWQVGPGASGYFTATSYSVRKIIEIGATSAGSVLVAEGIPFWWSNSGIYTMGQDDNSGYLSAKNLAQGRLDSFYGDIPIASKQYSQGVYDDLNKRIVWLYASSDGDRYKYDYALVYDVRLDAFTKWHFGMSSTAYVGGLLLVKDIADKNAKLKFIGITGTNTTVSIGEPSSTRSTYQDFGDTEVPAYMVTGHEVLGDASRLRVSNYVHVYMGKTETGFLAEEPVGDSSILLNSRWDWADNASAGKWGPSQQVYRHRRQYVPTGPSDTFDDGQPVLVTKNKVRGRGRSLALKFTCGDGKDGHIYGWQVETLVNTVV